MIAGITYDLKDDYLKEGFSEEESAEFDRLSTIDAIDNAIKKAGIKTERIGNVKSLIKQIASGKRWDFVFNITEGMYGIGREAQVPAILDAYGIPYTFSDPLVLSLCLHKGMTKRVVRDLKIPTPDFAEVSSPEDVEKIKLPFPLFAKPVAEGTSKGINANSKITTKAELKKVCVNLLKKFKQPVLVETYLPGREFTVGIIGSGKNSRAIGTLEVFLNDNAEMEAYSYSNKQNFETLVEYSAAKGKIAQQCERTALQVWRGLNCRDAGRVDIRLDKKGIPSFIEVNPLAGLNPDISDLPILCSLVKFPYQKLIEHIIKSTIKRIKK